VKLFFIATFLAVASAWAQTASVPADTTVQRAEAEWCNAIAAKSLEGTVAMYDPGAFTAGSGMPPARRRNSCHMGKSCVRRDAAEVASFSLT
jgi:hypothetical protein